MDNAPIRISTIAPASLTEVWKRWTSPADIINWNNASPDWHTPEADNDPVVGGRFRFLMAARDGSVSFAFCGTYTDVEAPTYLAYTIDDGRRVSVRFSEVADETEIVEEFEPENVNPREMQKMGWQAILDSFSRYVAELA
ncbi:MULTISPECIES: SRPBCC domain-containing protein [unclassified Flavobacterium]|uniref:SRPBCC domain-containing protein n=1 Tax=unclassified Flavobacterium TaxID=196869 RepID=UPI001F140878|nr:MULTISPECIES: SRPBCC domain-containing protein [unclassified Flavobacterium]UMY65009.1 SRPBCC domain-containing protein [Flavobacterium sp. HJ-32-4]